MSFDLSLLVWITKEYLSECKERDRLLKRSKKTGRDCDNIKYRRIRNRVVNFRKTLKKSYFKTEFHEAGTDQKKLWKIVKQLYGNPKRRNKINTINGEEEPEKMADEINRYFIDIAPDLAAAMHESLLDGDYVFNDDRELFDLHEIKAEEVSNIMNKISSNNKILENV